MQGFDPNNISGFVKAFVEENKQDVETLCRKMHDTCLAAANKIIEIELENACVSFAKKLHDPKHIRQYLFATIHNTISKSNNDKQIDAPLHIEDWSFDNSLIIPTTNLPFIKEDFRRYKKLLIDTINQQISMLEYSCRSATIELKTCMYLAFKNITHKHPEEMISYLVFLNRNIGIQCEIFQEFISILEKRQISHSDAIFAGESIFNAIIDEHHEIGNNTQELYAGRKGIYARPYYIGKLIDIVDDSNKSLMKNVKEYGFSKIIMSKRAKTGTNVIVKHMRIPPHHQMGTLSHLNRIRRSIVDRVYYSLNGKKRVVSR